MKFAIVTLFAFVMPTIAEASTTCTTRRSGNTTITSCSSSGHNSNYRQCRSYRSGNTIKTSCR